MAAVTCRKPLERVCFSPPVRPSLWPLRATKKGDVPSRPSEGCERFTDSLLLLLIFQPPGYSRPPAWAKMPRPFTAAWLVAVVYPLDEKVSECLEIHFV